MTDALIAHQSVCIFNLLLQIDIWHAQLFHLFLPIKRFKEVDTYQLLPLLFAKEKRVAVSKTMATTHQLVHFELLAGTLIKEDAWGIPTPVNPQTTIAPSEMDVVFVPLLAYDKKGNRIGYGKGFYDGFLKETNAIKIGLSFFEPTDEAITTEAYDVALDYCVSPNKIWDFKNV